ncbi:unnamed protein product [Gadus morhua 'NCC']
MEHPLDECGDGETQGPEDVPWMNGETHGRTCTGNPGEPEGHALSPLYSPTLQLLSTAPLYSPLWALRPPLYSPLHGPFSPLYSPL